MNQKNVIKLKRSFFNRDAATVAKELLGCFLVTELPEGKTVGKIVETESYLGAGDLSSHSYKGETRKNSVMFGPPGKLYVYFTYGMHYCFNTVTNRAGVGEGVLIRALEPIEGIDLMKKRRGLDDIKNLCNGPAKLAQAFGIDGKLNGSDLTVGPIYIIYKKHREEIITTKRIGITKSIDLPLRFYLKNSKFVSRK